MRRREFLIRSATAAGAVWLSSKSILNAIAEQTLAQKFSASDTVTLGHTGISTSRLAMGTGTVGSEHHSHQTALGVKGLSDLLLNGYDHGLRFFDAADSYGSHPHVAEGLRGPRLYAQESLPSGPAWTDVHRLLANAGGDSPADVRDRAPI